jgi:uncharacterized SAM-binding protein YcdF (DUF218 family)
MTPFLLKKVISFLLQPLGALLLLTLIIFWSIKFRQFLTKLLALLLFVAFFGLSYAPVANYLSAPLENKYTPYHNQKANYIVILGSGHNENPNIPRSSTLNGASTKRVLEGVIIYQHLKQTTLNSNPPKIIFTGAKGFGQSIGGGKINAELAKTLGVDQRDILTFNTEKDTEDEAKRIKQIVDKQSIIVVTSAMHMPRALKLFKLYKINTIPAPTDFKTKTARYLSFPRLQYLMQSNLAIHEYLGTMWLRLKTNLKALME